MKAEHPWREALLELPHVLDGLVREIPVAELAAIFFPPLMGLEILDSVTKQKGTEDGGNFQSELPVLEAFEAVLGATDWLARYYFHADVENATNVPNHGPVLLVGNHNAGLMSFDSMFAISELQRVQGRQRTVHPLVHDYAFAAKTLGKHAHRLGMLRATRHNADAALNAGRVVLVYPGGDKDAFRPFRDRYKTVLAGRKGFVRVALSHKVPVVPLVSVGLHESMIVLSSGEKLARAFKLKSWLHTEVAPVGLSLPWGLAPSFFTFLPLPTKVDMRFGEPILLQGDPEDEAAVEAGYQKVCASMQRIMDELSRGRKLWLGREAR
jgi:1-acyl-sn-glycerol-3-phosphate acyltransferase